jgi:hemerythrin-like domain-containing protein
MKLSDLLSDELDQILSMLDILEVMHDRLSRGEDINLNDLKRIIQFFKIFANRTHNKKEEKFLFPQLQRFSEQSHAIIDKLKSENSLAELYLRSLRSNLKNVQAGCPHAKNKLITLIKKYLVLEKTHLQNEQIFVIPLCNQEIPKEKQDQLLTEFNTYDEHLYGHGMQQKFHQAFRQAIDNLKKHYYTDN